MPRHKTTRVSERARLASYNGLATAIADYLDNPRDPATKEAVIEAAAAVREMPKGRDSETSLYITDPVNELLLPLRRNEKDIWKKLLDGTENLDAYDRLTMNSPWAAISA